MIHDVVIAGGGPVGLFLACELRLAELSVLVLEPVGTHYRSLRPSRFAERDRGATTRERRLGQQRVECPALDAAVTPPARPFCSAPDFELIDGTKLGELLTNGRGLFLDFDARASLRALASRWSGQIMYIGSDVNDRLGLSAVLVRPDGFVAWAGEASPDHEDAAHAASRWFGEPSSGR